ncbi:MAG TPA: ATP-dependent zinc metalloprotease FtsH [Actinomycetota bacterium]|nr:ATP-dependent zinc metalloprotease FtsH [Actinomycetota bacterium]
MSNEPDSGNPPPPPPPPPGSKTAPGGITAASAARKGGLVANVREAAERYMLRRRRARAAKQKMATRKTTIALSLVVIILMGAFAWSLNYNSPRSEGREVSFDVLAALAAENRVVTATFRDEDNRIVGTYAAQSILPEPEPEPKNKGKNAKGNAKNDKGANRPGGDDKNAKNDNKPKPKPEPEAEEVLNAPPGSGEYWLSYPSSDAAFGVLSELLTAAGSEVRVDPQTTKFIVRSVSTYLLPLLILAAFFGLLFTGARGGGSAIGEVMSFGTSGAKRQKRGFTQPVTFNDVGGEQEAVVELKEVVDYLQNPKRYEEIGAVPPKGVLLFGPPGCGKTLLAKAVAGEAGVPFFSVSGAEFVESLVGIGAARVRDLFRRVRAVAPAIVFIDELDATGRRRGGGEGGGSDEREQTLNQLLVEMDGFEISGGIVVVGATNRPDILDPALLRPGRFDRHITVDQPDAKGRKEILDIHSRNKPLASSVDLTYIAKRTPGFSGADLANVINEAALLSIRDEKGEIETVELEEAIQRVLHGPKRRGRVLSPEEERRGAYHEAAHAVVAASVGRGDEVHRVTILARAKGLASIGTLGLERSEADNLFFTRDQLFSQIVIAMAGLACEEVVLGDMSTGAEEDIEKATEVARDIVGRYGMSPVLGRTRILASDVDKFLGGDAGFGQISPETHEQFDNEVRRLVIAGETEARRIIDVNRPALDRLAAQLEELETLEGRVLVELLQPISVDKAGLSRPFTEFEGNGLGYPVRSRPAGKSSPSS